MNTFLKQKGMKQYKLIILCGKSASGKDTILRAITRGRDIKPTVSYTTRPMRPGEIHGRDYYFTYLSKFQSMIENGELLEYRQYNAIHNNEPVTWYYGTGKESINLLSSHYCTVLDLDGAKAAQQYFGKENCITIYVDADENTRTLRAKQRGGFELEEWERRLVADKEDFKNYEEVCEYYIENNDEVSIDKIVEVIRGLL